MPKQGATVVCLDEVAERLAQEPCHNPSSTVTVNHLAYVIYTSGSTGRPKSVLVEHEGFGNLAVAQMREFAMDTSSRVLQFASFSFDASVSELFSTWLAGATLYMATREELLPGPGLISLLREQQITVVTLPPSVLAVLADEAFPALRTVVSAGEACSAELVAHWSAGRRFVNAYGPTEATVCATMAACTAEDRIPPIGRVLANKRVYVLDAHMQPVPVGVPGELYIGGIGIARGYLNRPELTAERFLRDPFREGEQGRLYKTGDWVRYRADGHLEYLGRIDDQVKMRGFRIELGEIEAVLSQYPAVREAVGAK